MVELWSILKLVYRFQHRLYNILSNEQRRSAEAESLREQLKELGFSIERLYSDPLNGIGAALEIAEFYGITLHRGTCHGDCRAELAKENWVSDLNLDVPDYIINPGVPKRRKLEEITEISTWGSRPEIAIAKLLIAGRLAGVI